LRLYRRTIRDGNARQLTSEAPGTPYGLARGRAVRAHVSSGSDANAGRYRPRTLLNESAETAPALAVLIASPMPAGSDRLP